MTRTVDDDPRRCVASDEWAYIGRTTEPLKNWPVGSVVCVTSGRQEYTKDTAKVIAEWILDGLAIERVPVEWVRKNFGTTALYFPEPPQ